MPRPTRGGRPPVTHPSRAATALLISSTSITSTEVDAFRDELSALQTRMERAAEERDAARREVENLASKVATLRVRRTRKRRAWAYVVGSIAVFVIGWLAMLAFRTYALPPRQRQPVQLVNTSVRRGNEMVELRVEPPRFSWQRLTERCTDCTGMFTTDGPVLLGKHGGIFRMQTTGNNERLDVSFVREDTPAQADLLGGTQVPTGH